MDEKLKQEARYLKNKIKSLVLASNDCVVLFSQLTKNQKSKDMKGQE